MILIIGRVIKNVSGVFHVDCGGKHYSCAGRGRVKRVADEICVGDMVEFELNCEETCGIIDKLFPRRNFLIRPPIANVDQVVVVIAASPPPDFILVDKIVLNAVKNNIAVLLCVNKDDINGDAFHKNVADEYANAVDRLLFVSAKTGEGVAELEETLANKINCLAGQSAVGKSSLVNRLLAENISEIGEISMRSGRGRHTTRHSEVMKLKADGYIIDTPGFTFVDFLTMKEDGFRKNASLTEPGTLKDYYVDFNEYAGRCKYNGCKHLFEPGCAVKEAVASGQLPEGRYTRYKAIYEECDRRWKKRY